MIPMALKFSVASCLISFFYTGKFPKSPGTAGSFATILAMLGLAYLQHMPILTWLLQPLLMGVLLIGSYVIGVIAGNYYINITGKHDPKELVIDEVVGQLLTCVIAAWVVKLLALPMTSDLTFAVITGSFILFRFFDIVKPGPVGWADRELDHIHGVMLDDVFAGILAGILVSIILLIYSITL